MHVRHGGNVDLSVGLSVVLVLFTTLLVGHLLDFILQGLSNFLGGFHSLLKNGILLVILLFAVAML